MKLSGLFLSLILAFLLTLGITFSTKDSFIENKNAVYGLRFNSEMKEFGFRDSMRIKYINGEEIDRVSDIVKKILLKNGNIVVSVELDGDEQEIIINDSQKSELIQKRGSYPVAPIMTNGGDEIKVTTANHGFGDVLIHFGDLWKQAMYFINPEHKANDKMGGFIYVSEIKNILGYFMMLAINLLIVIIINLLPLPGFGVGNSVISAIETYRKKLYNKKRKLIIGWISILIIVSILVIRAL